MQVQRENNRMKTPERLFWITKKTVQRKLGSKEDEHIISSDAVLDAKIEVFKSISLTSADLSKIIDQYQERLCVLSQEECIFGRFLKEVGKRSKTTAQVITNTGKSISYSGQQRMCVRVPLLRLHHETEVFRFRAVKDTCETLNGMEKERTDYRAALSWMKSTSSELDPDTGRGLDKFRTAQSHVRVAKLNFDSLAQDSIQKIDLLAAARCNMYSHALVSYMNELRQFAQKTAATFDAISKSLLQKPKYDFCVLKDLKQEEEGIATNNTEEMVPVDKDQSLFFADEYIDEYNHSKEAVKNNAEEILIELVEQSEATSMPMNSIDEYLREAPQLSPKLLSNNIPNLKSKYNTFSPTAAANSNFTIEKIKANPKQNKQNLKSNKTNNWMDLFAELDPLANQETFDLKLHGGHANFQQT